MRKSIVLFCLLAFVPVGVSYGQNFDSVYGSGVHKYFSGCNAEAIQSFDAAIATNPNDPRPYYFRGLAKMQSGDQYAGQADFQMGAQMEAAGKRRSLLVSRSLERIQGTNRLCIEQARQNALNPSLQTAAQNYYGAPPTNEVSGQSLTYPPAAPGALPPTAYPAQAIIQVPPGPAPPMPGEIQIASPTDLSAGSTNVAPFADQLTTPESTSTSLPTTPPESVEVAAPKTTPAVESELEKPITLDSEDTATKAPAIDPAVEATAPDKTPPVIEPESAPADGPSGSETAGETDVPEAPGTAVTGDSPPIEFPSEPTDESPFGDAPFEEADAPTEDVPTEDTTSEPQDSNEESTDEDLPEEDRDVNDDPFGG